MALNTSAAIDEPKTLDAALKLLIGEQLSSVEFVHDYLQLRFDGPCLTVYSPIHRLLKNGVLIHWGQPGYCDALCGLITHELKMTTVDPQRGLFIFDNDSVWSLSLRDEDYSGPEVLMYVDGSQKMWVV